MRCHLYTHPHHTTHLRVREWFLVHDDVVIQIEVWRGLPMMPSEERSVHTLAEAKHNHRMAVSVDFMFIIHHRSYRG